ncbi:MAG: VWA domain-containing protein [Verrucomicrobia bacterium]|nr:VWA domain-containing protein [Verrucomicrobiota bacterium]
MTFRYPWLLLLVLLVPLLTYVRYGRRRTPSLRFSDGTTLGKLPLSWAVLGHNLLPALYTIGLLCLVVALARPQKGLEESRVRTEGVDIVLLVDVSTSMNAEDFSSLTKHINRLDAAKLVIEKFVRKRDNDRIAMVAFAALPYTIVPLTLDHGWLIGQMDRLQTGMLEDGTAIGSALGSAINRLRESEAKSKVVILLTDGVNNAGTLSPENAAEAARALGIKVYTVGAGSSGYVRVPVTDAFGGQRYIRQLSEIDERTLQHIARTTDARYFRAEDLKALSDVYDEIDKLERTEIDVEQFTTFEEKFMGFVWAAVILLLLDKLMSFGRLGRLP